MMLSKLNSNYTSNTQSNSMCSIFFNCLKNVFLLLACLNQDPCKVCTHHIWLMCS